MSTFLLQCLSHTPLMGQLQPDAATVQKVHEAIGRLRHRLLSFDPDIVFLFGPDHFNGFFYDLMPSFCIGAAAQAIGDYGGPTGPLNVPEKIASACADSVVASGIDSAISYRMQVDHGFTQPLQLLAGSLEQYATIPVFINSVAPPLPSMQRARLLGEAIGRFATSLRCRTAFIASGGLSHNPPVPVLENAPPDIAERLIAGRNPTVEQRRQREARTLAAAQQFAHGESALQPLNPEWDKAFLDTLCHQPLSTLDTMANSTITQQAGASGHEVKTWVAATAAMTAATTGKQSLRTEFYQPIPEWIAGFALLQGEMHQ